MKVFRSENIFSYRFVRLFDDITETIVVENLICL